jgi:pyruvate dehydrogenase E2 component (dihydrolipoamide acetyltransferase)
MSDVVMPRLSDSMEEGTILKWLVEPGAAVRRGDELVEIETDKATMTYEADADGVVELVAAEGDTLPIGAVIARIGGPGATAASGARGGNGASPADEDAFDPNISGQVRPHSPEPVPAPSSAAAAAAPSADRPKASPLARRLAQESSVDLATLHGTGPGGRIVKADVEAAAAAPAAPSPSVPSPTTATASQTAPQTAKGDVRVVDLTRTQQVVARRMAESKATVPDFTLNVDVDMTLAVDLRAQLKAVSDPAPSFNDMIVRACALALREFPRANGAYRDGKWELYSRVNVGIAVAAQDSLVVPTVFDADRQTVAEIAAATKRLAERVRSGEITPPELSGGTFTVSNLGMYGITSFTAVINPPQAAILAVGAIDTHRVMRLTLSCDHRILYGADAAQFLARIRELLEQPVALLL